MRYFLSITIVFIIFLGCVKRQSGMLFVDRKPLINNLSYFDLNDTLNSSPDWNLLVYLNEGANLSCFEDMDSWRELEKISDRYNGNISIWTNQNDSSDVYWALKLEKINTPFNIIDSTKLKELKWDKFPTHFKVLFNNQYIPITKPEELSQEAHINIEIKDLLHKVIFYNRL